MPHTRKARVIPTGDMMVSYLGSPMYMAPEVLNHQTYTNRADIWSLGVIFFEMLTGHGPYPEAVSPPHLCQLINTKPIRFPTNVDPVRVAILAFKRHFLTNDS